MSSQVTHVFLDVNMGCQHNGLKELAKKKNVNLDKLPAMTSAIFVSRNRNRIKLYSYNGVLHYLRSDEYGGQLDYACVQEFAQSFGNDDVSLPKKIQSILVSAFSAIRDRDRAVSQAEKIVVIPPGPRIIIRKPTGERRYVGGARA